MQYGLLDHHFTSIVMGFSYFQLPMTVYTVLFTPSRKESALIAAARRAARSVFSSAIHHAPKPVSN